MRRFRITATIVIEEDDRVILQRQYASVQHGQPYASYVPDAERDDVLVAKAVESLIRCAVSEVRGTLR